jgi:hypothetical protein
MYLTLIHVSLRVWLCYINIHGHVTGIYTNGNRAIILHRYIMAKFGEHQHALAGPGISDVTDDVTGSSNKQWF